MGMTAAEDAAIAEAFADLDSRLTRLASTVGSLARFAVDEAETVEEHIGTLATALRAHQDVLAHLVEQQSRPSLWRRVRTVFADRERLSPEGLL